MDSLNLTVSDGTDVIEAANVTINNVTKTTNEEGKVTFDLEYGDYEVTVNAEGFTTATDELSFRSNHKNFTVTLTNE